MAIWMPINEAAQILEIHPRTLRRHVDNGKRTSRMEDGKRMVLLEEDEVATATATANANDSANDSANGNGTANDNDHMDVIAEKDKRIEDLQSQVQTLEGALSDLQSRFDFLQNEASESRTRSDTIILQLTRQFEQQTVMLEDMRNKPSRARELWHRLKVVLIKAGTPAYRHE